MSPTTPPEYGPELPRRYAGSADNPGPSYVDPTVSPASYAAPSPTWPQAHPATSTAVAQAPRRNRRRRTLAILAAASLLGGAIGLSSTYVGGAPTADSAVNAEASAHGQSSNGLSGLGGSPQVPGSGSGSGSAGSNGTRVGQAAPVDSTSATAAEQKGVALVDTVLTNGEAAGTGIVLTADGQILTNYHVVEGSTSIRVTIASTGATYSATVVGHDQAADVALLQLADAGGLTVATIDTDTAGLGDTVTAVGNAGGTGELSAADGKITDLSTSITTQSESGVQGEQLKGLIETSSDVVAGDSGGPLLDAEGEVVGIDTAASSGQVINGYAIPIDDALLVVTQILTGRETSAVQIGPAAFLGVQLAQTYGGADGATIAGTTNGGAAAKAGLAAGDTITEVGGTRIGDSTELSSAIAKHEAGDRVKISWTTTDGATRSATVTLGSSPVN